MTLVKRYKMNGLNLADSDINRPSDYASDLQNVELDDRRQLVKRYGFEEFETESVIGLFEYVKGNSLIKFTSSGVSGEPLGTVATPTWTTEPDSAEYNGVMYFTDPTLDNELYKFDGYSVYRAGLPALEIISQSTTGLTYWYRAFYTYIDGNKNIVNGDYAEFGATGTSVDIEVSTLSDTEYKNRYGLIDPLAPNQSLSKGNQYTLTFSAGHTLVAGDTMMIVSTNTSDPLVSKLSLIEIESISGNDVTINTNLFDDGDEVSNTITDGSLFSIAIKYFSSTDQSFGYAGTLASYILPIYQNSPTQTLTLNYTDSTSTGVWSLPYTFMEDEYDTTVIKGEPPKCKYITIYNNIMVLANTSETVARNKQKDSSFFWSDTGVGSTVETFPPLNTDDVGISSEGEITGIFAISDNVIAAKDRQVYYINGSLILQNYRIRSALTSGIGCVSFKSMIEVDGGALYMSQKGLYLAYSGRKPIELSAIIEPLFKDTDLDLTNAKSINDRLNEKILIHIPHTTDDIVLVYDYKYKEWFLHRGINASNGFTMLVNDMYFSNDTTIFIKNTSYNDNGSAVDAYYKTSWEHQGNPSVTKKWKKFVVISIGDSQFDLKVKHQEDWEDTDITNLERQIGPITVDDFSLNMSQKKAMRLEFGNNKINQGLLVTGYEYEFADTQKRPKGES